MWSHLVLFVRFFFSCKLFSIRKQTISRVHKRRERKPRQLFANIAIKFWKFQIELEVMFDKSNTFGRIAQILTVSVAKVTILILFRWGENGHAGCQEQYEKVSQTYCFRLLSYWLTFSKILFLLFRTQSYFINIHVLFHTYPGLVPGSSCLRSFPRGCDSWAEEFFPSKAWKYS